jgi:hypothetical protein
MPAAWSSAAGTKTHAPRSRPRRTERRLLAGSYCGMDDARDRESVLGRIDGLGERAAGAREELGRELLDVAVELVLLELGLDHERGRSKIA